ncbi:uncharacterized protein LOC125219941 isoform X2 [Salvia hispanica]|uniref:uncharacterized protein LOC125219941 isoform X2 n=1 Tax=Salvia hispanica TaxID=49212 RepID=UPI002008F663|nr:uncharacterized protein LOC125219941 isoform X2 [Salvia hispanica]
MRLLGLVVGLGPISDGMSDLHMVLWESRFWWSLRWGSLGLAVGHKSIFDAGVDSVGGRGSIVLLYIVIFLLDILFAMFCTSSFQMPNIWFLQFSREGSSGLLQCQKEYMVASSGLMLGYLYSVSSGSFCYMDILFAPSPTTI